MPETSNKRIIGLYGEMCLAMELHQKDWQVYRAYIDEQIDFIIARYYCQDCGRFSTLEKRKSNQNTGQSFLSNLCSICSQDSLQIAVRFIQVKTSEGVAATDEYRKYSFHAKLHSNVDDRAFYAWIALTQMSGKYIPHFYIFRHTEISKFDDLTLDSYQKTNNQKTTLRINDRGEVLNKGIKHNYACFRDFHNNFEKLDLGVPGG